MSQNWNFHTHTFRCKHATGTVSDYAKAAVDAGFTDLGMSDHSPLPDGFWPESRMHLTEYPDYRAEITAARHEFPGLKIWAGLECEGNANYFPFYRDTYLSESPLDYLVGAVHFYQDGTEIRGAWDGMTPSQLASYVATFIQAMESGLFLFMAHPDVFANDYPRWDATATAAARDISRASVALGVPLEINTNGMRKPKVPGDQGPRWPYPIEPFWAVAAEEGVTAVVSSDAHRPQDIAAGLAVGAEWISRFGLSTVDLRNRITMSRERAGG